MRARLTEWVRIIGCGAVLAAGLWAYMTFALLASQIVEGTPR